MEIVIPGEPISKARPRAVIRGGKVLFFDPKSTEKKSVKEKMKNLLKESEEKNLFECSNDSYVVEMIFYMPYPKKSNKSKVQSLQYHNKKPDVDNLAKFYLDCANGILFPDDSQVRKMICQKVYSANPRTCISIHNEG